MNNRRQTLFALGGLALAGTASLAHAATPGATASPGQPAPDFTLSGADGKALTLQSLRGKTVVLEWTNHLCPYVRKHYESGNMPGLQKDAAGQGVVWLQVISSAPGGQGHVDGPTALKVNAERQSRPAGTLLDPEGRVGRLYGAKTTPHMYIINAQGLLVYAGAIDSIASSRQDDIAKAEPYVRNALAEVLAGKPVSKPSTRPYGCGVKYSDA
jgi:AhpC/TSA family